jgi:hypothetical protein
MYATEVLEPEKLCTIPLQQHMLCERDDGHSESQEEVRGHDEMRQGGLASGSGHYV